MKSPSLPPLVEVPIEHRWKEIGRAVQQECRARAPHSSPTRRSSDLNYLNLSQTQVRQKVSCYEKSKPSATGRGPDRTPVEGDRKSGSAGMPSPSSTLFPHTTLFRSKLFKS